MNSNELLIFHEKLYFHELDSRDKINSRLQILVALLTSLWAALAFMISEVRINSAWDTYTHCLVLLYIACIISMLFANYYFVRSWFGNTYKALPAAQETQKYLNQLEATYHNFANHEQLVSKYFSNYLLSYYCECSTSNTVVNDTRAEFMHKSSAAIIVTAVFAFLTFLLLYFFK